MIDQSDRGPQIDLHGIGASFTISPAAMIVFKGRHVPFQHTLYPGKDEFANATSDIGPSAGM
jgi:hypothetical protein